MIEISNFLVYVFICGMLLFALNTTYPYVKDFK